MVNPDDATYLHIYTLINRYLETVDRSSSSVRWSVYETLKLSLLRHYEFDKSTEEYRAVADAFDRCIAQVEREANTPGEEGGAFADADAGSARKVQEAGGSIFVRVKQTVERVASLYEWASKAITVVFLSFLIFGGAYWFIVSNDEKLPELQRRALQDTACKFFDEERCSQLIAAIERTKSASIIRAANAGDLKPAEQAIAETANRVATDPKSSPADKMQAQKDLALVATALGRMEAQLATANASLERVEVLAREAKKETSSDPLKELANYGVTPSSKDQSWVAATQSSNTRILGLLLKSNLKPSDDALISIFREGSYNKALREFYSPLQNKIIDLICKPNDFPSPDLRVYPGLTTPLKTYRAIGREEWRFFCQKNAKLFVEYYDGQIREIDSIQKMHDDAVKNFNSCKIKYKLVEQKWRDWRGAPFREWSRRVDALPSDEKAMYSSIGHTDNIYNMAIFIAFMDILKVDKSSGVDANRYCYKLVENRLVFPSVLAKRRSDLNEQKVVVDALR